MLDIVITCNLLTDIFPVGKDTTSAGNTDCMKGLLVSYLEPVMRRRTFIKNIILSALWVSMQFLYKNNNMTLYVGIIDQCLDFIVLPIVIVKSKGVQNSLIYRQLSAYQFQGRINASFSRIYIDLKIPGTWSQYLIDWDKILWELSTFSDKS